MRMNGMEAEQTTLQITATTEQDAFQTNPLLHKLRTLISNNNSPTKSPTTFGGKQLNEFELINKMATLTPKDLKDNKYKHLLRDIKITVKKQKIKNFEKIIKKNLRSSKDSSKKFCAPFNSARKLFLLFIFSLKKKQGSKEILLYTNIINNLCINNKNEYYQDLSLMLSGVLNINESFVSQFCNANIGLDGIAPITKFIDRSKLGIVDLNSLLLEQPDDFLKRLNITIENFETFCSSLNLNFFYSFGLNSSIEVKKLLESGASNYFLRTSPALLPVYYLFSLDSDPDFSDINIRLSVRKIGSFIIEKYNFQDTNKNLQNRIVCELFIKYLNLLLVESESQTVVYEAVCMLIRIHSNGFQPRDNKKTIEKSIISYKYKDSKKVAGLKETQHENLIGDIKHSLLKLDHDLLFEVFKRFGNTIHNYLSRNEIEAKLHELVKIFSYQVTDLGIDISDKLLLDIYKNTVFEKEKIIILRKILTKNVKAVDVDILRLDSESYELNKVKLEILRNIGTNNKENIVFPFLNINSDMFYLVCDLSVSSFGKLIPLLAMILKIQTTEPVPQDILSIINQKSFTKNVMKYPDAISNSLIMYLRENRDQDIDLCRKILKELLKLTEKTTYEKYTNVFLCCGNLEALVDKENIQNSDKKEIKPTKDLKNTESIKESPKESDTDEFLKNLNIPTQKSPTSHFNTKNLTQHTSFSEILYVESTYVLKGEKLIIDFTFINQSQISVSEIQISPITPLKIIDIVSEFSLGKRSIMNKRMTFQLSNDYKAMLVDSNQQVNNIESVVDPVVVDLCLSFKYSKNNARKAEMLHLKPIQIDIDDMLDKDHKKIECENFNDLWKKLEWERLQVIKTQKIVFEDLLNVLKKNFSIVRQIRNRGVGIVNCSTHLNNREVLVNIMSNVDSLRIRVRGVEKNLVENVCDFLKKGILKI